MIPLGDFFPSQKVIKRNIKMSTKVTAITDPFSPIKSHR